MPANFYYVYALKDPQESHARPFYVGKGTGSRAWDHLVKPDSSEKYKRIRGIVKSGLQPIVAILADELTESQALKIESELIGAFGTQATGGPLTNVVMPTGLGSKKRKDLVVPYGTIERAQIGLNMIKSAISEFAEANPGGVTNADVASVLGLRSDYRGKQKDYLSYSVLGLLLREGKINREGTRHKKNGASSC